MKRRRGQAGFTMVELLISMLVASVITASIYFVFRSQSRIFYVQESIAQVQSDLRFSMETIKADLKRAGYLGMLNSSTDMFYCGTRPNPPIAALQHVDGAAAPVNSNYATGSFVYNPAQNVNILPDSIRILGAFNANATWYTTGITGTTISISTDPALSPGFPTTAADFNRIFRTGTLLRILDNTNSLQIQRVTAATFAPPSDGGAGASATVTVGAIANNSIAGCGPRGVGEGNMINTLEYVRYRIVDATPVSMDACGNAQALVGRTRLVRENLDPDGTTVSATLELADNVVDLKFSFMNNTAAPGLQPVIPLDPNPYDFVGNVASATVNANPENVLSVGIFLAGRTTAEDPNFAFRPRMVFNYKGQEGIGPITTYKLDPNSPGACRVRSLTSEVQLRNFGLPQRI